MEFPFQTLNEAETTAPRLLQAICMEDPRLVSEALSSSTTTSATCPLVPRLAVVLALALSNHLDLMSDIHSVQRVGLFLDLHISKIFDLKWMIDTRLVVLLHAQLIL
jgi:hypothetical protein